MRRRPAADRRSRIAGGGDPSAPVVLFGADGVEQMYYTRRGAEQPAGAAPTEMVIRADHNEPPIVRRRCRSPSSIPTAYRFVARAARFAAMVGRFAGVVARFAAPPGRRARATGFGLTGFACNAS